MTCKHERGDFIKDMGFWLCSSCWKRLEQRPYRLGMVATPSELVRAETTDRQRQDVIWRAEIHRDEAFNTLGAFLRAMVKRFQFKTRPRMSDADAYDLAISIMQNLGDDFGDPAYDWSVEGAREFADEEMQYFDEATGCGN